MNPCRLLVVVLVALVLTAPLPAQDKDGFVPLFNGKDLSGWVPVNVHPKTFLVKDGEIVTTGKPTGYMRTEKQYENFILEMEWLHVNKTEVGNSGLFVWGDVLPVPGSPFTRGVEVQVLVNLEYKDKKTGAITATSHGDVFSIQGATCKPDRPHPLGWTRCLPSENRAKGGGEWNHYKVTAVNGAIKLEVNGKEVSGVSECKPHRKGYLALESEGAECHFRNIRIKELPSTNPKPEEVGPVAQGHVNLLTGIELLNWKADEEQQKHWQFQDYRLVYDGKGEGKARYVWSEKAYSDVELIADIRLSGKKEAAGSAGVLVRFGDKGGVQLNVSADSVTGALLSDQGGRPFVPGGTRGAKPAGQWNRFQITAKGATMSVSLNGERVLENASVSGTPASGSVALFGEGPAEYANIFIRELKKD